MKRLIRSLTIGAAAAALLGLLTGSVLAGVLINPGAVNSRIKLAPDVPLKATPFDMTQVRLLDGPFKQDLESEHQYLLGLDNDRLLHNFRVTSGLPSSAQPLAGWESPTTELRGHYVGHVLSGLALMYASTGDEKLKDKGAALVAELAKCQAANTVKGQKGYLGGYPEEMIMELINGTRRPWAPWYTLHKIMAGLLDMYVICGNTQALQVVEGMAQWTKAVLDPKTDQEIQSMLQTEFGGMAEVLANLYTVTGKKEYLDTATTKFYHARVMDPLAARRDELQGLHINTNVPKMIGEGAIYEMNKDPKAQTIADYFWNQLVYHRVYITGGIGFGEGFGAPPDVISTLLNGATHENCVTYNLLKLTRHVFSWTADPKVADYYERALFNGIMGTQDPTPGRGGSFEYSVYMGPGSTRQYNNQDNEFTCCLGSGLESFAKLGDSIYFHDADSVFVNLFIPSELTWGDKAIKLTQTTRYPYEEATTIKVSATAPVDLTIKIRIPSWANQGNLIKVNGQRIVEPKAVQYAAIQRTWKDGDTIEVSLPMSLHLEATPDNPNVAAIMYGPIVLAGKLGGGAPDAAGRGQGGGRGGAQATNPRLMAVDLKAPQKWIHKVDQNTLTFKTVGVGQPDVTLVPFMDVSGTQRYALYWNMYSSEEAAKMKNELPKLPAGVVDMVLVGNRGSQILHNESAAGARSGSDQGRAWLRTSNAIGYELAVTPDAPMAIKVAYKADDTTQSLQVSVDNTPLEVKPISAKAGELTEVSYAIPPELIQGKKMVAVTLRTVPPVGAGGRGARGAGGGRGRGRGPQPQTPMIYSIAMVSNK